MSTNSFQIEDNSSNKDIKNKAIAEFDALYSKLIENKIKVHLLEDTEVEKLPDAVFLNNWFSTHHGSRLFVYPMMSELRRREVREELLHFISGNYFIGQMVDLRNENQGNRFLEGTGSLVFDYRNELVYASISERTHPSLVEKAAAALDFKAIQFESFDINGKPIYHTNVMMSIGEKQVVICVEAIENIIERNMVIKQLESSGREIITISHSQMNHFCGNIYEVCRTKKKPVWLMSETAYQNFNDEQKNQLAKHNEILSSPIENIEKMGGGSVRCMLAANFLDTSN